MRYMRNHNQLKWFTEISVTPLLDLVFILLFAFMVALPLVSQTDSLLTPSPIRSAAPAQTPKETITLSLLSPDSIRWNGSEMPEISLETRLAESLRNQPNLGVIIEVSPDLPVSRLVSPMAILQKTGVQSTAIRLIASTVQ